MATNEIVVKHNINSANTTGGRSPEISNNNNFKQMLASLEKMFSGLPKEIAKDITRAIMPEVVRLVSKSIGTSSGGATGVSKADITNLVSTVAKEAARQATSHLEKSAKYGTSTGNAGRQPNIASFYASMDKRVESIMSSQLSSLKQKGIKLESSTEKAIIALAQQATRSSIPNDFTSAVKEMSSAVKTLGASGSEIHKAIKAIGNLRTSGGGLDFKELIPYLSNTKNIGKDLKNTHEAVKKVSSAIEKLPSDYRKSFSDVLTELKSLTAEIKKGLVAKVSQVRSKGEEDPQKFAAAITRQLKKALDSSPALQNTQLAKAVDKMVNGVADISSLQKAISKFSSELAQIKGADPKNIRSVEQAIDKMEKVLIAASKITIDGSAIKSKQWKKYVDQFDSMISKMSDAIVKVRLVFDDSGVLKAMAEFKDKEFKVTAKADTKEAKKKIDSDITDREVKAVVVADTGAAEKYINKATKDRTTKLILEAKTKESKSVAGIDKRIENIEKALDNFFTVLGKYSSDRKSLESNIQGKKYYKGNLNDLSATMQGDYKSLFDEFSKEVKSRNYGYLKPRIQREMAPVHSSENYQHFPKEVQKAFELLNSALEEAPQRLLNKVSKKSTSSDKELVNALKDLKKELKNIGVASDNSDIVREVKSYGASLLSKLEAAGKDVESLKSIIRKEGGITNYDGQLFSSYVSDGVKNAISSVRDIVETRSTDSSKAASKEAKRIKDGIKETANNFTEASRIIADSTEKLKKQAGRSGVGDGMASKGGLPQGLPSGSPLFNTKTQGSNYYNYGKQLINPNMSGISSRDGEVTTKGGEEIRKVVSENVKGLSKSLFELQQYIVDTLDKELKASHNKIGGNEWKIVRDHAKQNINEYFKIASGYNKKMSGKQWTLQIADIDRLRRTVGDFDPKSTPTSLIKQFKEQNFRNLVSKNEQRLPEAISGWMKRFSEAEIKSWDNLPELVVKKLARIKRTTDTGPGISEKMLNAVTELGQDQLKSIYKQTISEIDSIQKLTGGWTEQNGVDQSPLVRNVSLPAARLNPTGAATFETAQGSQRVIPKFAVYKTGFEELYEKLHESGNLKLDKKYAETIRSGGIRPDPSQFTEFNNLAENMLRDLASAPGKEGEALGFIKGQYRKASKIRGAELKKTGQIDDISAFNKQIEDAFSKTHGGLDNFMEAMENIGVSAYDVAKSMEKVEFKDIYQMFKKLISGAGDPKSSPLVALAANPSYDRNIRDYETYMRKLVGTIPIADPKKPRRYAHQERVINLMSMASPIFEGGKGEGSGASDFTSDQQKEFIRDLNLSLRDFIKNNEVLGETRGLPEHIKNISSLGVPEAQAATLDEYRKTARNEDTKYLGTFNATNLKMYTDNLAEISPFGAQFQQLGRNIASTTNAMSAFKVGMESTDFPKLRSEKEDSLISSGRYGGEGYGFNVIAELRNTASTFEDQILVSGKLADVMTESVKTIVGPDGLGRLGDLANSGLLDNLDTAAVSNIEAKKLVKLVGDADRVFQEVLGVKSEYKGRADEALIKDVGKMITVVRGKELNVQTAKLAETFLNYYGRKFTTRFGSKGVSVTPQGEGTEFGRILKEFPDKKIKVLSKSEAEKAGLGTAVLPKSMGKLLDEILEKNASELQSKGFTGVEVGELQTNLLKSGNKFIMDMFTDASLGVVTSDEAELNKTLFNKINNALKTLNLGEIDKNIEGINQIKSLYKTQIGEKDAKLFEEKPIDIRISSYGAAKRGLQTETLETIMNNVISAGETGSTVVKDKFDKSVYRSLLGTATGSKEDPKKFPSLSEFSKALGFEGAGKDKSQISKDLFETFMSKETKGGTVSLIDRDQFVKDYTKEMSGSIDPDKLESEYQKAVASAEDVLREKADKLAELEARSNYYTSVIDEFGDARKGLVGSKFVEIVEDPHKYDEWSKKDIEKQIKGERLNIPAFGAYASIFGEQSEFMKDMLGNVPTESKKHWEYIKALQVLNEESAEMRKNLLSSAKKVDVSSLKSFTKSTGTFVPGLDESRSLSDTILDADKFPGPVDLSIPSTMDPSKRESFYVPGAIARSTYPEPTIAGERGLDLISRRLQQVVNAAKKVDELMNSKERGEGSVRKDRTIGRVKSNINKLREEAREIAKRTPKKEMTPQGDAQAIQDIIDSLMPVISGYKPDPDLTIGYNQWNDAAKYIENVRSSQMAKVNAGEKNVGEALYYTLGQVVDVIIGADPKGSSSEKRKEASSMLTEKVALGQNALEQFSKKLGITPPEGDEDKIINNALDSLEKAKIKYYHSLAETVLGKTGSIQEFVFTRKVPAIMSKAVTAVVDKTKEFKSLEDSLRDVAEGASNLGIETSLKGLEEAADELRQVRFEHSEDIRKLSKDKGLPVLKQHELGVPKELAEKLPVEFNRKASFDYKLGEFKFDEKGTKEDTTLDVLLEHRDKLKKALSKKGLKVGKKTIKVEDEIRGEVEKYIKAELTPYVESVRYPFTGISSVQPYEAKLLKPKKGERQFEKHSLIVPGIPEMDFQAFDKVKSSVEQNIESLRGEREKEWKKITPDTDKIEKLNIVIDRLSQVLSDAIPKYIAHQQKLDFDGDQIEIHSAKTAKARKEIETHFKTLIDYNINKGTTAQVLRDDFTYDAMVPSTGKYPIAEQAMAFNKKFKESEGFGFLQKPFLTEDLEYLSKEERLGILSSFPSAATGKPRGPVTALNEAASAVIRDQGQLSKLDDIISNVSTVDASGKKLDDSEYISKLLTTVEKADSRLSKILEASVRDRLFESKFLNTINAQLFKINTGPDTEALNRILKIFERSLGFGSKGIIGTPSKGRLGLDYNPSESLSEMFPEDLKIFKSKDSDMMGNELHTMMNEIIRVAFQKGMDVKHAGEVPIATEMYELLTQGQTGLETLVKKINEDDSYADIKSLKEVNETALKRRMGGLSTEDIRKDAVKIATSRGEDPETAGLAYADRDTLKTYIVEKLNLTNFLSEITRQVEQAAYDGIIEQIKSWDIKTRSKKLKGKTPEQFAKDTIATQMKDGGLDIKGMAEGGLMPLYKYRTMGSSLYKQRGEYQNKYGDVDASFLEGRFKGKPDELKEYTKKIKEAKALARNLKDEFSNFNIYDSGDKGSYAMFVQSAIDNVKSDSEEIKRLVAQLNEEEGLMDSSVLDRALGKSTRHQFTRDVFSEPSDKASEKYLEKYSRIVGVPSLGTESKARIRKKYLEGAAVAAEQRVAMREDSRETYKGGPEKYDQLVEQETEQILRDVIKVAQADLILRAAKARATESRFVQNMFGETVPPGKSKSELSSSRRQEILDQARDMYATTITGYGQQPPGIGGTPGMASGGGKRYHGMGGSGGLLSGEGPIPVHIASIENGVGLIIGGSGVGVNASMSPHTSKLDHPMFTSDLIKDIKRAREIASELTGGLNELKDTTYEFKYRASGLKGGAGRNQIDEIAAVMAGAEEDKAILDASSLRGTAMHAKLEPRYKAAKISGLKTYTEEPVKYEDPKAGLITGTVDVLRKDLDGVVQEVIDIKTVSPENFKKLKDAVDASGSIKFEDVKKAIPDIKKNKYLRNEKLDEVASQLNLYLASQNKNAKAEAHFYNALDDSMSEVVAIQFDFDEKRLEADMSAVSAAREKVKDSALGFAKSGSFEASQKAVEGVDKARKDKGEEYFKKIEDELMAIGKRYYELIRERKAYGVGAPAMPSRGGISKDELKNLWAATRNQTKGLDQFIKANPRVSGDETIPVSQNLIAFHQAAKMMQAQEGVSLDPATLDSMRPELKGIIDKIPSEGKKGIEFTEAVNKLVDENKISRTEVNKAWKTYRVAVGDYYVSMIEKAKQELAKAQESGDLRAQSTKYVDFEVAVANFQDYIRSSLGKGTDIYTRDKRYMTPELAKGAKVYMDPQSIAKKASTELGDNEKLKSIFDKVVDVREGEYPIPQDAVRKMLIELTNMDKELAKVIVDAREVAQLGPEIVKAWDFSQLRVGLARLKAAMQKYMTGPLHEWDAEQKEYLTKVLKRIKVLEDLYGNIDISQTGESGFRTGTTGVVPVPKELLPNEQRAWHERNLEMERLRFSLPEEEGGPKEGAVNSYDYKIFGQNNRVIENHKHMFEKYGDVMTETGQKIGRFNEKHRDLIKEMMAGKRPFSVAIERVVKWGAAASLVYGSIRELKDTLSHIAEVEYAMAKLSMVMSPISTDFDKMQKSAISFAKSYGVGVEDVLEGMRVYAQQGLGQEEVIDRTRTSVVASNITELDSSGATEALTAAMKIFRQEGESSMRFLDSWSNVESKAAIKAGDLADAIKKSAAAGRNAGFTFDELNGMIAAIGSVTRQTGKEVGTSLRFIFRRLTTDKGPKALKAQGIDILGDKGELKAGFDILSELAAKWDELTRAEKLNISQAIGGTRQYNALLTLMDNWGEAQRSIKNSIESKGSAERRNLALMKTYTKQLEKTKAAFSELKISIGKIVLPTFKTGLKGLRGFVEVVNDIPGPIKAVTAALIGLYTYISKGQGLLDKFSDIFGGVGSSMGSIQDSFKLNMKRGLYEGLGIGNKETNSALYNLNKIGDPGANGFNKFESSVGDMAYLTASAFKGINNFIGVTTDETGKATSAIGELAEKISNMLSKIGMIAGLAPIPGILDEIIAVGTTAASVPLDFFGDTTKWVGENVSKKAQGFLDTFASENTGLVKAAVPSLALGTIGALALPSLVKSFKTLAESAEDYKEAQYDIIVSEEKQLDVLDELIGRYDKLSEKRKNIIEEPVYSKDIGEKRRKISVDEYKSPLLERVRVAREFRDYQNDLAKIAPELVAGFDEFGNAEVYDTEKIRSYLKELEKVQKLQTSMRYVDIAGKFAEDLTETGGVQNKKKFWKDVSKEIPLVGGLFEDQIKLGPKKALSIVQDEMNRLNIARRENPFTKAFDKDLESLSKALVKATEHYSDQIDEFQKAIDNISAEGLDTDRVVDMLSNPKILKGFEEVVIPYSVELNEPTIKGRVSTEDVLASEVFKKLKPELSGVISPIADLTMAKFEESGIKRRLPDAFGKVDLKAGDYVAFTDEFADKYNIASNQAFDTIVEGDKVRFKYFNETLKEVMMTDSVDSSDIDGIVKAVFPVREMINKMEDELVKLDVFVTGAAAGIPGLSDKMLKKREVDLGARFFSGISTNTLLQTPMGYDMRTGELSKEVSYKKGWDDDFINSLYKPIQKYKSLLDEVRASTSEPDKSIYGEAKAEQIELYQDLIKNNQATFQFRAALVDLGKELYNTRDEVEKNIQAEKNRQIVQKNTAGYLKGISKGLDSVDVGIRDYEDLNVQQRTLLNNDSYSQMVKDLITSEKRLEGYNEQLIKIASTAQDLEKIKDVNSAWGGRFETEEQFSKWNKIKERTGGDRGATEIVTAVHRVKDDTSTMVEKLDTLIGVVSAPDEETKEVILSTNKALSKAIETAPQTEHERIFSTKGIQSGWHKGKFVEGIQNLMAIRDDEVVSSGANSKVAARIDNIVNKFLAEYMNSFGIERTTKEFALNSDIPGSRLNRGQYMGRALTGMGMTPDKLINVIERSTKSSGPKSDIAKSIYESKEYGNFIKALGKERNEVSGLVKGINKATVFATIQSQFANVESDKKVAEFTKIVSDLKDQRKARVIELTRINKPLEGDTRLEGLDEKIKANQTVLDESKLDRYIYGTARDLFALNSVAINATQQMEATPAQTVQAMTAITGVYGLTKVISAVFGEELPKFFEKAKGSMEEMQEAMAEGKSFKDIGEDQKKAWGKDALDFLAAMQDRIKSKKIDKLPESDKSKTESLKDLSDVIKVEKLIKDAQESYKAGKTDRIAKKALGTLVGAAGATLAGYASNQMGFSVELSQNTAIAADQARALAELFRKNAKEFDQLFAMDREKHPKDYVDEKGEGSKLPISAVDVAESFENKALALNKAIKESGEIMTSTEKATIERVKAEQEVQSIIQDNIASMMSFTEKLMILEDVTKKIRVAINEFDTQRKFKPTLAVGNALVGYGGDINLPLSKDKMSTQQRIWSEGSEVLQNILTDYKKLAIVRDNFADRIPILEEDIYKLTKFVPDNPETVAQKDTSLENLKIILDGVEASAALANEALLDIGENLNPFVQYSDAFYELRRSLESINVDSAIRQIDRLGAYFEGMDKLYGGSHPDAPIAISEAQKFKGIRSGVSLKNLESTQYDLRESELMDQIIRGNLSGDQKTEVLMEYINLPKQRKQDIENYKYSKSIDSFRNRMAPYEKFAMDMERLRFSGQINENNIKPYTETQRKLESIMKAAQVEISKEEKLKEFDTAVAELSESEREDREYELKSRRKTIEEGPDVQRRGPGLNAESLLSDFIGQWRNTISKNLTGNAKDLLDSIKNSGVLEKIDVSNTWLELIAKSLGDKGWGETPYDVAKAVVAEIEGKLKAVPMRERPPEKDVLDSKTDLEKKYSRRPEAEFLAPFDLIGEAKLSPKKRLPSEVAEDLNKGILDVIKTMINPKYALAVFGAASLSPAAAYSGRFSSEADRSDEKEGTPTLLKPLNATLKSLGYVKKAFDFMMPSMADFSWLGKTALGAVKSTVSGPSRGDFLEKIRKEDTIAQVKSDYSKPFTDDDKSEGWLEKIYSGIKEMSSKLPDKDESPNQEKPFTVGRAPGGLAKPTYNEILKAHAVNGKVSGEGDQESDSVLARLSTGEFVLKADSVEKLGIDALAYMNNTGKIPPFAKFAEGGEVGSISEKNKALSEKYKGVKFNFKDNEYFNLDQYNKLAPYIEKILDKYPEIQDGLTIGLFDGNLPKGHDLKDFKHSTRLGAHAASNVMRNSDGSINRKSKVLLNSSSLFDKNSPLRLYDSYAYDPISTLMHEFGHRKDFIDQRYSPEKRIGVLDRLWGIPKKNLTPYGRDNSNEERYAEIFALHEMSGDPDRIDASGELKESIEEFHSKKWPDIDPRTKIDGLPSFASGGFVAKSIDEKNKALSKKYPGTNFNYKKNDYFNLDKYNQLSPYIEKFLERYPEAAKGLTLGLFDGNLNESDFKKWSDEARGLHDPAGVKDGSYISSALINSKKLSGNKSYLSEEDIMTLLHELGHRKAGVDSIQNPRKMATIKDILRNIPMKNLSPHISYELAGYPISFTKPSEAYAELFAQHTMSGDPDRIDAPGEFKDAVNKFYGKSWPGPRIFEENNEDEISKLWGEDTATATMRRNKRVLGERAQLRVADANARAEEFKERLAKDAKTREYLRSDEFESEYGKSLRDGKIGDLNRLTGSRTMEVDGIKVGRLTKRAFMEDFVREQIKNKAYRPEGFVPSQERGKVYTGFQGVHPSYSSGKEKKRSVLDTYTLKRDRMKDLSLELNDKLQSDSLSKDEREKLERDKELLVRGMRIYKLMESVHKKGGNIFTDPSLFKELHVKDLLTDKQLKEYEDKNMVGPGYTMRSSALKSFNDIFKSVVFTSDVEKRGGKIREVTDRLEKMKYDKNIGFYDIWELRKYLEPGAIEKFLKESERKRRPEEHGHVATHIDQDPVYNSNARQFYDNVNNGSNPPLHLGTDSVPKTGNYFLQKDEMVLPKNTPTLDTSNIASNTLNNGTDMKSIVNELKNITLNAKLDNDTVELNTKEVIAKLENDTVRLENNTVRLENDTVVVKLENDTVRLENDTVIAKLENDTVRLENNTVRLENDTVRLENSTVTARLENDTVRIDQASIPESAGAAANDKLQELIMSVNDKLMASNVQFDSRIKVLEDTPVIDSSVTNQEVDFIAEQKMNSVRSEITDLSIDTDVKINNLTSLINRADRSAQEAERMARTALTKIK